MQRAVQLLLVLVVVRIVRRRWKSGYLVNISDMLAKQHILANSSEKDPKSDCSVKINLNPLLHVQSITESTHWKFPKQCCSWSHLLSALEHLIVCTVAAWQKRNKLEQVSKRL